MVVNIKDYHSDASPTMLTQLPAEIISQIIGYLSREETRSIALTCSGLQPHAYRRFYRVIRIFVEKGILIPFHAKLVLHYPHLLLYASSLLILPSGRTPLAIRLYPREHRDIPETPLDCLCSHFASMHRLTSISLHFAAGNHTTVLSALEKLDPPRHITLDFNFDPMLQPDIFITSSSLPVQSIYIPVDESGSRLGNNLLQRWSPSISRLGLLLHSTSTLDIPFLPHLRIFSLYLRGNDNCDLTSWLPFFARHPLLSSVSLDRSFTSVTSAPLPLLPTLQSLKAHPLIIGKLISGRPVHYIDLQFYGSAPCNINTAFQSLSLSNGPVTTLNIASGILLLTDTLIDMIHILPMLRAFKLSTVHEARPRLIGRYL